MVDVFDANNIVLTKIRTRLNLNQIKRHLSGVFETVHAPKWNEDRLILAQQNLFIIRVTMAVPLTITQCSARWKCFCSDVSRRVTVMRLT